MAEPTSLRRLSLDPLALRFNKKRGIEARDIGLSTNILFFVLNWLWELANLSVNRIKGALVNLGLSETDAEIYIYLYTNGSKKARNIICNLDLRKGQAYRSLKRLQLQGIATSSGEFPSVFSAVPFELVLSLLLDAKKEQINSLKASKEELISTWRSITKKDDTKS